MHIDQLCLKNYRNYESFCTDLKAGLNLIIGKNAVGKTNLLEAIYFLENGCSHRTNNHQEIIRWNEEFSVVKASLQRMDRDMSVEATIVKNGKKQIKVNGVVQKGFKGKVRPVTAVIFTPDHLKIVKEMPEHRRAYIDDILEKIKADYKYWRQQYLKVLRQRNMLLKKVYTGQMRENIIDYWDKQLIDAGIKIITARRDTIKRLEHLSWQAYMKMAGTEVELVLKYENQLLLEEEVETSLELRYIDELRKKRKAEIERGLTLVGPHRDDVGIYINGIDMRTYGSQGEQRSAALALKMAELSILTESIKETPLLLLDDVMSELDEARRQMFMGNINNGTQTIITSTNMDYFNESDLNDANILRIG